MKTVVYVDINCKECKVKAMKAVAKLSDVKKIELDPEKNTVAVTGEVDPIDVVKKLRKTVKMAELVAAGPEKEEDLPHICGTCDSFSVAILSDFSPIECSII